jgi:hypothetical protein
MSAELKNSPSLEQLGLEELTAKGFMQLSG